jgi:hypothetical protein
MRELGHIRYDLQPGRRKFWRARKVVCDLPSKQLAIRQFCDRTHKCLRRQFSQPHRQVGRARRLGERAAFDHTRQRRRDIESRPRHGECEQQRGKADCQVGDARMTGGQTAHGILDAGMKSREPPFAQVTASGLPARGQQQRSGHDKKFRRRGARGPQADSI